MKKEISNSTMGVQSEKNIWWQSAWALPHESHDTLRWYFERAGIKHIISLQVHGQKLQVSGIGNFDIEWHLGGYLKTLKCMLGCKGAAKGMRQGREEASRGEKPMRDGF